MSITIDSTEYDETTFEFHYDAGHGWLKVPTNDVDHLGIAGMISHYSFWDNEFYYLEEDCDFALFEEAYTRSYGHELLIKEIDDGIKSPLRNKRHVASHETI